ncbi:MAG: leucine-rich repeat protein [Bacteroidales bacterium]|nr:leucine-rich repeat protein [Bacteroidales bacterium]
MSNDYFNPPNSIWPNALKRDEEDYVIFYPLGTNKVDINTVKWPKGDKFIFPFIYQDDKLVGFIDTKALTTDSQTLIYLPYEHIEAEFLAIDKEQLQIHAPNATTKKASWKDSEKEDIPEAQFKYKGCTTRDDVKTVNANYQTTDIVNGVWSEPLWDLEEGDKGNLNGGMFYNCDNLKSFSSDLPSLTNGKYMFSECDNLTSFSSDLSSLTDGTGMFYDCSNLTSFSSDLASLTNGTCMFYDCSNLTSFSSDSSGSPVNLSSLTDGNGMFMYCALTSFNSDLSSLTNGNQMFQRCSNLTSFSSDLSSLTTGTNMFIQCKLDTSSVQNIADTINTYSGTIHIGIGNSSPNAEEEAAFNSMVSKGWTVYVNGSQYTPTSPAAITTLDENGIETTTPIPFWAKPVPTDEEHARYVDEQGNFFNILGGQFIYGDSLESYGMFTCEEDAAQNMRLTPYTKL